MLEADRSNSSMVLMTGKAAALRRARVLEASREAISASIRVRSTSSGGPALGLGGEQQLRGELAHRAELEPA